MTGTSCDIKLPFSCDSRIETKTNIYKSPTRESKDEGFCSELSGPHSEPSLEIRRHRLTAFSARWKYQPGTTHVSILSAQVRSASLAAILSLEKLRWSERPHLVIVPSLDDAYGLERLLVSSSQRSESYILPAFDVGVYSGLYPNRRVITQRLGWLWRAGHAKGRAKFSSLRLKRWHQKTIPFSTLRQCSFST